MDHVPRGSFSTPIDSVFPLQSAGEAQDKMLRNDVFGKILLQP